MQEKLCSTKKASTYQAWARLRTRLARIQMLVLGSEE
jgi:hypothetical protein